MKKIIICILLATIVFVGFNKTVVADSDVGDIQTKVDYDDANNKVTVTIKADNSLLSSKKPLMEVYGTFNNPKVKYYETGSSTATIVPFDYESGTISLEVKKSGTFIVEEGDVSHTPSNDLTNPGYKHPLTGIE